MTRKPALSDFAQSQIRFALSETLAVLKDCERVAPRDLIRELAADREHINATLQALRRPSPRTNLHQMASQSLSIANFRLNALQRLESREFRSRARDARFRVIEADKFLSAPA